MPGLFVQRHARAVAQYAHVSVLYVHPLSPAAHTIQPGIFLEQKTGLTEVAVYYKSLQKYFPGAEIIKGVLYIYHTWKGFRFLKRLRGPFDLIHVNILTRAALFPFLLKIVNGTPYIITEHWSRYLPAVNTYRGVLRKMITRLVAHQASALTAVTYNLKSAMEKHGIYNSVFEIIPNVVDTEFFTPPPQPTQQKILLHVSCFEDRSKNISGLLKAIAALKRKRNDFRVLLVGEGQDFEAMKRLCRELSLNDVVTFTGLAEGEKLLEYYRQSCSLVMFSNYENMPVVINESLSCGKPIIATAVGGIPEIMNSPPPKGIMVEPGDIPGLVNAMDTLLNTFQTFDAEVLRQYAVENFSTNAIAAAFLNLYKRCLNKGKK